MSIPTEAIGAEIQVVGAGIFRGASEGSGDGFLAVNEDIAHAPGQGIPIGIRPQAARFARIFHFAGQFDGQAPFLHERLLATVGRCNDHTTTRDSRAHGRIPAGTPTCADVGVCGSQQLGAFVSRKSPAEHQPNARAAGPGQCTFKNFADRAFVIARADVDNQLDRFVGTEAAPKRLDDQLGRIAIK